MILRKLVSSVVSRLHPQLCGIERFVGRLKSAGAESAADEADGGSYTTTVAYTSNNV